MNMHNPIQPAKRKNPIKFIQIYSIKIKTFMVEFNQNQNSYGWLFMEVDATVPSKFEVQGRILTDIKFECSKSIICGVGSQTFDARR